MIRKTIGILLSLSIVIFVALGVTSYHINSPIEETMYYLLMAIIAIMLERNC